MGQLSPLKNYRLILQWYIVRIYLKTVCQYSFKGCQYYFKGSILKNPDIFKKILTHFKKILTPFKKILTLFKKILTTPFVRIFVPHHQYDQLNLGIPDACFTYTPGTWCAEGEVFYDSDDSEHPSRINSVEECVSLCLGQVSWRDEEEDFEDYGFNWKPYGGDDKCKCVRKVCKLIQHSFVLSPET